MVSVGSDGVPAASIDVAVPGSAENECAPEPVQDEATVVVSSVPEPSTAAVDEVLEMEGASQAASTVAGGVVAEAPVEVRGHGTELYGRRVFLFV